MKILAFMPTLGRPHLVEQAIRMFELQTWQDREMLVYDTANQMPEISGDRWRIVHQGELPWSMGTTCNVGIRLSDAPLIARWDDDDHYLPWHLEACIEALTTGRWSCPSVVWDYVLPDLPSLVKTTHRDGGKWAYAGAWAFRRDAFEEVGGYSEEHFREEECDFRNALIATSGPPADTITMRFPAASYVYLGNKVPRSSHYGQLTDDQRRAAQQKRWPKVESISPRWPEGYMAGFPTNPVARQRHF